MRYTNSTKAGTFENYLFVTNLQGDIIHIYDDAGTRLVTYNYDAWGNHTVSYENNGNTTAARYNPFRYRGYYYDVETGLYYLNSRYYDPQVGRFINADSYVSTGQGLLGNNMFTYCGNNPINRVDPYGYCYHQAPYDKYYNFFCRMCAVYGPGYSNVGISTTTFNVLNASSLPLYGAPGSKGILYNPDGTIKQERWYGPDGLLEHDRDHNHPGDDLEFPHDHTWDEKSRSKDHTKPDPKYKIEWDRVGTIIGGIVIIVGGIGVLVGTGNPAPLQQALGSLA